MAPFIFSNQSSLSRHLFGIIGFVLLASACGKAPDPNAQNANAGYSSNPDVELVSIHSDDRGLRLQVEGTDFWVAGVNWDYFPIGTTYTYSLWSQPDAFIMEALDREMRLLQEMGVNAIRQYVGVPPRWVEYIHKTYGIYTVLNHALGRYGVQVDGEYLDNTDYSDPAARDVIKNEVLAMVTDFKDTPGVLMWLLGNENNYGLVWSSAETENLPEGERDVARAVHLYSLFSETAQAIKTIDTMRPVAIANGDLQYMDLIVQEAEGIDILGTNMYRGTSFGDAFQRVADRLGKPILFTEFGADAYDVVQAREDQRTQAKYLVHQWKEQYENAAGNGGTGNAIGGLAFQWSDGWWKYAQDRNLDVHDEHASWFNGAYREDFVEGQNNMNEEWWGIMAKEPPNQEGLFDLVPREAFFVTQKVLLLNPYAEGVVAAEIEAHFSEIESAFSK